MTEEYKYRGVQLGKGPVVMIDIETVIQNDVTKPNVMFDFAAVAWHSDTPHISSGVTYKVLHDAESEEPNTMAFHANNGRDAQWFDDHKNVAISPREFIDKFTNWMAQLPDGFNPSADEIPTIVCKGTDFDKVIINKIHTDHNEEPPFRYWQWVDLRTIQAAAYMVDPVSVTSMVGSRYTEDNLNTYPKHSGIADAYWQKNELEHWLWVLARTTC